MKKSIFITGASSGIGKATAILFANKGWFVGIADVNEAGLTELKKYAGRGIGFSARLDVTDAEMISSVLSDFNRAAGGKIDVLFNCAGIYRLNPFEDISLKDHHLIVNVNVKGVLNCTYLAFPYLKNTAGSRVINMASTASVFPVAAEVTYSASKFWVRGFTEALNIEWQRHGIQVSDIMPSFVDTPMVAQNPGALVDNVGVKITPEDVAETVWKAAGSKRLHWVIDNPMNKLFLRMKSGILPFSLLRFMLKKMSGLN
jgi:NAD(P)-dependent dehydrogenase (short-subunit alcohol dehydrogenase family)